MHRRFFSLLAIALLSAAPTMALSAPPVHIDRSCGTAEPDVIEQEISRAAARRMIDEGRAHANGLIHVAFHVITGHGEGNVPDSQIEAQIRELNRSYAGTGFRFVLDSVDRTDNPSWFKMGPGTGAEKQAKQDLAIDPAHHLNLYTCRPGHDLLGWAYFPFSAPEDHFIHGVVIHYASLPGGAIAPYNLGGTADHEVGHYLGLFHTFQGGCVAPGDEIDDTPFEASPAFGCPEGRNTCPQPGDDPIHNYMDYSDDACYTEFTPNQIERMGAITAAYRPSLFNGSIESAAIRPAQLTPVAALKPVLEFRGAGPNPFRDATVLYFSLTRPEPVSLKVFDVAGKLVATLIDGRLPEGDHSALFRGDGLAAGMYFVSLRAGDEKATRSMMLVR